MLIEQIIELQLRVLDPLTKHETCTPITGYFHEKTIASKANL